MFLEKMEETLNNEFNVSETENGALGYRTTGKNLLDLNFQVANLRNASEKEIIQRFTKAFYENKELSIKWLFYVRDIREGMGERRLFRVISRHLADNNPEILKKLIKYVPFYGRYDDLFCLLETECEKEVLELIKKQLFEDVAKMIQKEPCSLLAKWLPSECTKDKEKKKYVNIIIKYLNLKPKEYRTMLTSLRKYLEVVETKISKNQWKDINYSAVPSSANLKYNAAFLRHDEKRRREFLSSVTKGEQKINSSVLFPHDIVHKYAISRWDDRTKNDQTLEELWKALPNLVPENNNTIVVADGSGSMIMRVGKTLVTALDIANALAIYFSERSGGEFKDKYITFSEEPQLVDFSNCKNLREKINVALNYDEVANTNIEAVFDLILTTAKKNKMEQKDLPSNILIISDMEFDCAVDGDVNQKLFDNIKNRYEEAGYKLPKLIFWNVNSRTNTIPLAENELGVVLISGFSTNLIKMCMSNKTDPYKCLVEQLMSDRYKNITI
jgi:hypothetical protein